MTRNPLRHLGVLATLLASSAGFLGCNESDSVVASNTAASETTNGFHSRVTDTLGKPIGRLRVTVLGVESWIDSSSEVPGFRTDSIGMVKVAGLDSGEYRVEITDGSQGTSFPLLVVPGGQLQFQESRVRPMATVRGRVPLPEGIEHAWVQIQGGAIGVWTDSLGNFEIPVSVGLSPVILRAVSVLDSLPLGQDTLLLAPGEIRDLGELRDPFRVGSVTIGPEPGTYEYGVMVLLTTKVPGARIHYTLDGSKPGPNSPVYDQTLDIQKSTLIRTWAVKQGLRPSPQESAWVRIRVRPVQFNPMGGDPLKVWIFSSTYGSHARCTTDGTLPTRESPLCDTIQITRTGWIKAIGVMEGLEDSRVDSAWFQGPSSP
ncbi:MAG: chitobiase/beta-hexosaminidase C-terminal domain-containing protein [Fibrobacteria bacterium]|nr:chitobiase/beta-hexosaminidase C-terminal domain-containing protein [Fibrobacteria bacterium]